jgi:hypothetical protein
VFAPIPNPETGNVLLAVPVTYIAPGGTVDTGQRGYLVLALDADGAVAQRSLMLRQENGTLGQVDPDPAGTLQTIVQQLGADGSRVPVPSEMYTDPPSLPADLAALDIIVKPVAPGDGSTLAQNLAIGIETTDAGGSTQFAFSQFVG